MSFIVLIIGSVTLGHACTHWLVFRDRYERLFFQLLFGFSVFAAVILFVGSWSLSNARVAVVLLCLISCIRVLGWLSPGAETKRAPATERSVLTVLETISLISAGVILALTFITALAPATSWDAAVAHLALPAAYAREGRFYVFEGNAYSAYPHFMHALYAFVFFDGGERGVQLLGWFFSLLACVGAYVLGSRVLGRKEGIVAAAILSATPIFIDQSGTAALDLAFLAYSLGALAALSAYYAEKDARWLFFSAFLVGSSCGIRHTGYLIGALFVASILFSSLSVSMKMRNSLLFGLTMVLAAFPWWFRSLVTVHSPLYPFFTEWVGTNPLPDAPVTTLGGHESLRLRGFTGLLRFPWMIVMRPDWFDGWQRSPGGLVLALGIPGLFLGGRSVRYLGLFSLSGLAAFYVFQQHARYMLPFFAPMMVVSAVAVTGPTWWYGIGRGILYTAFGLGIGLACAGAVIRGPAAFHLESREAYLSRRVERYGAFQWANNHFTPDTVVLLLDPRSYYYQGRSYQNPESLKGLCGKTVSEQVQWLKSREIRYVMMPHVYITESPGFRETGLLGMFETWMQDPEHFHLVKRLELPRVRRAGVERVDFYEVR